MLLKATDEGACGACDIKSYMQKDTEVAIARWSEHHASCVMKI